MICHNPHKAKLDEIMWKNPTDSHNHINRDHSFEAMMYKDLGDDPSVFCKRFPQTDV